MKTQTYIFLMLLGIAFSCTKLETSKENSSGIVLTNDQAAFTAIAQNRSSLNGDPFDLKKIVFSDNSVEVTVAYGGGCKKHSFEFIWNGIIAKTNPPEINMFIKHNANGDSCYALITEILTFPLTDLTGSITYPDLTFSVMNSADPADSVVYKGEKTEFEFVESDTCNMVVTAKYAICGYGLYGNLWFALEDSVSAGVSDYYFNKYLQPVAINSTIKGFTPVAGKRYRIGGRIDRNNYFPDIVVCHAYPGPSIPVKIMCIKPAD